MRQNLTPDQSASHARDLLNNPVWEAVLTDIEREAVTAMVFADPGSHDERQARAAEVRAVRQIRDRLTSIILEASVKPRNPIAA